MVLMGNHCSVGTRRRLEVGDGAGCIHLAGMSTLLNSKICMIRVVAVLSTSDKWCGESEHEISYI